MPFGLSGGFHVTAMASDDITKALIPAGGPGTLSDTNNYAN